MANTAVVVLVTLDTKLEAARFVCSALEQQGVFPLVLDLSFRPQTRSEQLRWEVQRALPVTGRASTLDRGQLASLVTTEGLKLAEALLAQGKLHGLLGVGGANGCTVACGIMRQMPATLPKAMVTPVAEIGRAHV